MGWPQHHPRNKYAAQILQGSPSDLDSPSSSLRSHRIRTFVKSFSAGSRGYENMHTVKQNMKQLLMPWKRKVKENGEEEVQSNDDFGTHPVLQVSIQLGKPHPQAKYTDIFDGF